MMFGNNSGGTPPPTKLTSGRATVPNPGTAVQIGTGVCRKVIITAPSGNTDNIYVGDSSVSAVSGQEHGILVTPTGSATIDIANISSVYIDAVHAGDAATFIYLT